MDRRTQCTARLVSKTFCTAASPHICSLTLQSTSQAMSHEHFPRLDRVTVYHSGEEVDPDLRELITTLTIRDCQDLPMGEILSQLATMPKLQHLNVWWYSGEEFDVEGTAALACHLTSEEWITIPGAAPGSVLARLVPSIGSTNVSWLPQAMALRNLQALSIVGPPVSLPLIGGLTGLTGLTWACHRRRSYALALASPSFIAPLTRLTKLRSLRLDYPLPDSALEVACSLNSGFLVNLDLEPACIPRVLPDCGRFLTRPMALTCLGVKSALCNWRHIGALRVELLQSLKLRSPTPVDAEGLAVLRKATSLTELYICIYRERGGLQQPCPFLSQALAGLTRLRSLILQHRGQPAKLLDYNLALRPLTGLTELAVCRGRLDNGDLRALYVLTRLRVLHLCSSCLTDDVVPELAVLTNLEKLRLFECGVTSLAPVTEVLNPLRHAMGWPPMLARLH